jgi:type 1 fimbriae regulatory protein FimB/type 1 fimbriae regulatory protein FimE
MQHTAVSCFPVNESRRSSRSLANDGHDTRSLQHYLGHKNIQHTVRYTELAADRFKDFWR